MTESDNPGIEFDQVFKDLDGAVQRGAVAEVLQPAALREEIAAEVAALARTYATNGSAPRRRGASKGA